MPRLHSQTGFLYGGCVSSAKVVQIGHRFLELVTWILPGRDSTLEAAVLVVADFAKGLECGGEIGMTVAWKHTIAVGEVNIGNVLATGANRIAQMGILDVHMEEVGHRRNTRTPDGFADVDTVLNGARPPLFVSIQGFDDQAAPALLGVGCDLFFEDRSQ